MELAALPPPCLLLLCLLLPLGQAENSTSITDTPDLNPTPVTSTAPEEGNMTVAECLIDNQMGLIAIGSAGGLIVCLLVAVVTLACQVHHLQSRVYIPRSSRSNLDLAGYWANGASILEREAGGVVGPCDATVMLEEIKNQQEEELTEIMEEEEEEDGAAGMGLSPEEKPLMQSESRESSSDLPRDLEDIPLVL